MELTDDQNAVILKYVVEAAPEEWLRQIIERNKACIARLQEFEATPSNEQRESVIEIGCPQCQAAMKGLCNWGCHDGCDWGRAFESVLGVQYLSFVCCNVVFNDLTYRQVSLLSPGIDADHAHIGYNANMARVYSGRADTYEKPLAFCRGHIEWCEAELKHRGLPLSNPSEEADHAGG